MPKEETINLDLYQSTAIRPGVYRHYKGNHYRVIGEVVLDGPRTPMVLYIPLYGKGEPTVRDKAEFLSLIGEADQVRRFEFVHD